MDVSVSRSPLTVAVTRSRRYLTTATLLLVGVTITLVSVLSVAQHSLQRVRSDFTDNLLARVMTVTQSFGTDGLQPLNRAAVQSIETVAAVGTQVPGFTAVQFELGGGVEDERGRVRHVLGVDDDGSRLFGLPDTPATVAFALDGSTGATSLRIPVVEVGDDGYTAHDSRTIGLTLEAVPNPDAATYLLGGHTEGIILVREDTFRHITELSFGQDWDGVLARWNAGELPMTPLVGAVHVVPDQLDQVEPVAQRLRAAGFAPRYALAAFNDLDVSLSAQVTAALTLASILFLGAGVYFLATWRTYVRLARRDMGILRHWGADTREISRAYAQVLRRSLLWALAVGIVVSLVATTLAMGPVGGLTATGLNVALLLILFCSVWYIGERWILAKPLSEPILELLRKNREFQ